jgi:hypothetical protein
VFLDDAYARLVGLAHGAHIAAMRAVVEELLVADRQMLGAVRRRRFYYEPPPGWQARGELYAATWFPLRYPQLNACIRVDGALPCASLGRAELLAALTPRGEPAHTSAVSHATLRGDQLAWTGDIEVHVALPSDGVFTYPFRLDCRAADATESLAVLAAMLASVEPIVVPT